MSEITCPDCKGEGILRGFGCPGFKPVTLPCLTCQGKKTIDEKTLEWKKIGEEMRKERIARDVSLREEAKERGMAPQVLSAMERGSMQPIRRNHGSAG